MAKFNTEADGEQIDMKGKPLRSRVLAALDLTEAYGKPSIFAMHAE
jgi:hypothetical protein